MRPKISIISHKSHSKRSFQCSVVMQDNLKIDSKSHLSLVLLNNELRNQDVDYIALQAWKAQMPNKEQQKKLKQGAHKALIQARKKGKFKKKYERQLRNYFRNQAVIVHDNKLEVTEYNHPLGGRCKHELYQRTPHPNSLAGYLLLKSHLFAQTGKRIPGIPDDVADWLFLRDEWLNEELEKHGDLVCHYCGKPHLEIGGLANFEELRANNKNNNLATIDHKKAKATHPELIYEKSNFIVSCKRCNRRKDQMSYEDFMELIKDEPKYQDRPQKSKKKRKKKVLTTSN